MDHGNDKRSDTIPSLDKQFGAGTISARQMGAPATSRRDQEQTLDARERARTVEERGYALQMG